MDPCKSGQKKEHSCRHIEGISCDVENCYYHDCDKHCTAREISVGPHHAGTSDETVCSTFRPKTENQTF